MVQIQFKYELTKTSKSYYFNTPTWAIDMKNCSLSFKKNGPKSCKVSNNKVMGDKKAVHITPMPAQHKPNLPGGRALVKQSATMLLVLQYSNITSYRETLSLAK